MQFMQRLHGDGVQPPFKLETVKSTKGFGRFFLAWLKVSWVDLITMGILGGLALGIYETPVAAIRNFPVTFTESGDIVYPEWAYPYRGWIISPSLSAALSTVVPIVIIFLAQIRVRNFWDVNNAVLGLLYSLILSTLFQVIIKQLIGGFRPYFLQICMPDISLAATHNTTGLNGVGFHQIMYTIDICTQPDKSKLKTATTSFPSGHATTACAGYIYLFLYANAKLKVWADYRTAFWKIALSFAPLLAAALLTSCLTVDQVHNWYDVVAGAIIGSAAAFACYRGCYAAVFDWRYNHLPLERRNQFSYARDGTVDHRLGAFTHTAGWGPKGSILPVKKVTSARSSGTYANRRGSTAHHNPLQGVQHPPETARTRHGLHNGDVRGDNIV